MIESILTSAAIVIITIAALFLARIVYRFVRSVRAVPAAAPVAPRNVRVTPPAESFIRVTDGGDEICIGEKRYRIYDGNWFQDHDDEWKPVATARYLELRDIRDGYLATQSFKSRGK